MAYALSEARMELLETLGEAIDELAFSLAALNEAYERLDDHNRERLEQGPFRSVQAAFGRAKRTYTEFAARHGLATRAFDEDPSAGANSSGAAGFLERATEAAGSADLILAGLQDSMLPIEAGDEEVRGGLAAVRERLGAVPDQVRDLVRTLGR